MIPMLVSLFGPMAFKAVAAGITTAAATDVVGTITHNCNFQDIGQTIWMNLGAYVVGHLVTWMVPNQAKK
ncbi:MAG: hypothetical protein KGL39_36525 [Patescibacteria group bacterium]|nr:hypothetical protein [Patescibacteria group bacterium]